MNEKEKAIVEAARAFVAEVKRSGITRRDGVDIKIILTEKAYDKLVDACSEASD